MGALKGSLEIMETQERKMNREPIAGVWRNIVEIAGNGSTRHHYLLSCGHRATVDTEVPLPNGNRPCTKAKAHFCTQCDPESVELR